MYDERGRIREAHEIGEAGATENMFLQFEWDGLRLMQVRGLQGSEKNPLKVYERTLHYQNDRLVGETIQGQAKQSNIKYNYNGNRLVSAECGADLTLDGRSRKVVFLPNSTSTQVN
jgi:hypothetical protein